VNIGCRHACGGCNSAVVCASVCTAIPGCHLQGELLGQADVSSPIASSSFAARVVCCLVCVQYPWQGWWCSCAGWHEAACAATRPGPASNRRHSSTGDPLQQDGGTGCTVSEHDEQLGQQPVLARSTWPSANMWMCADVVAVVRQHSVVVWSTCAPRLPSCLCFTAS
jgi:hypothetical protein